MLNQSRTLSGITGSDQIVIPSTPSSILINGEEGPAGYLVGVDNVTGNVSWVQASTPFIPPNSIIGEDLNSNIGFETTASENAGVIKIHNSSNNATLDADRVITSDLVLNDDLVVDDIRVKSTLTLDTDGNNKFLEFSATNGDLVQFDTDHSTEVASIKSGDIICKNITGFDGQLNGLNVGSTTTDNKFIGMYNGGFVSNQNTILLESTSNGGQLGMRKLISGMSEQTITLDGTNGNITQTEGLSRLNKVLVEGVALDTFIINNGEFRFKKDIDPEGNTLIHMSSDFLGASQVFSDANSNSTIQLLGATGNIQCNDIDCANIDVSGNISVDGVISGNIDLDGDLEVDNITVNNNIRVENQAVILGQTLASGISSTGSITTSADMSCRNLNNSGTILSQGKITGMGDGEFFGHIHIDGTGSTGPFDGNIIDDDLYLGKDLIMDANIGKIRLENFSNQLEIGATGTGGGIFFTDNSSAKIQGNTTTQTICNNLDLRSDTNLFPSLDDVDRYNYAMLWDPPTLNTWNLTGSMSEFKNLAGYSSGGTRRTQLDFTFQVGGFGANQNTAEITLTFTASFLDGGFFLGLGLIRDDGSVAAIVPETCRLIVGDATKHSFGIHTERFILRGQNPDTNIRVAPFIFGTSSSTGTIATFYAGPNGGTTPSPYTPSYSGWFFYSRSLSSINYSRRTSNLPA